MVDDTRAPWALERVERSKPQLVRVGKGFENATKVLQHEYLLNYVLEYIACGVGCHGRMLYISTANYERCIHDSMFAQLLRVSKRWFRVAAPYIWKNANQIRLKELIEACQENGVCAIPIFPESIFTTPSTKCI